MATAKVERVTVRGIELETVRRGSGRQILMLHGFQTIDPNAPFLELLARHGEVIAPSSPGFGQSPRPKDFDTVYDLVHLYLEMLDMLPGDKVDLDRVLLRRLAGRRGRGCLQSSVGQTRSR